MLIDWLVGVLTPNLAVLELYLGMNKFYELISSSTRPFEIRHICV